MGKKEMLRYRNFKFRVYKLNHISFYAPLSYVKKHHLGVNKISETIFLGVRGYLLA